MTKLHIKRDDTVVVISGDSKGTRGKVIAAAPEEGKVIVAGANIVSKHTKARKQGENSAIIKTEGAIYASKVQLVCPKCDKGDFLNYLIDNLGVILCIAGTYVNNYLIKLRNLHYR